MARDAFVEILESDAGHLESFLEISYGESK